MTAGSPQCVLALATMCLFSGSVALPHKTSSSKLTVAGPSDARDIAIGASGQGEALSSHHSHVAGEARAAPHMRREATHAVEASSLAEYLALAEKPTGINMTEHPPSLTPEEAADRLTPDGILDTFNAAPDSSQVVKLEEETMECTMTTPVWECMEKHGSYGVRRLFSDSIDDFTKMKNWRMDWMAHPDVQRKKFLDITWPGTHDSGAYDFDPAILNTAEVGKASVKGAITQHLDVYTQLKIGVRAIEVQVAVGKHDGQLYSANGFLMMSLATILTDIASFLETHHQEVVLLYMKKAEVWNGVELAHIQPLKDEESNTNKIAGESVHKGVTAVLGQHLATHSRLKDLPASEDPQNPSIDKAIAAGIRVFYFWEGQQVLCINKGECTKTPGYAGAHVGRPLAFGPGMPIGARESINHGGIVHDDGVETKFVEPGCIHSSTSTQSSNPMQLLLNIKKYAGALKDDAKKHPPACWPKDGTIPEVHTPTLLYEADLWASPFSQEEGAKRETYKDIAEIYTRGESATLKSEAERVNYLSLNWLLRKNWQPLFTKLSIISMDYIAPINIHRIVEANQNREDCGYAIYCKVTGSCWAQTLLDDEANACRGEALVLNTLRWHAEGEPWPIWLWIVGIVFTGVFVKSLCITGCCYARGNSALPQCCFEGGAGLVWWKRQKADPLLADSGEGEVHGEAEEEPEQQQMESDEAAEEPPSSSSDLAATQAF